MKKLAHKGIMGHTEKESQIVLMIITKEVVVKEYLLYKILLFPYCAFFTPHHCIALLESYQQITKKPLYRTSGVATNGVGRASLSSCSNLH